MGSASYVPFYRRDKKLLWHTLVAGLVVSLLALLWWGWQRQRSPLNTFQTYNQAMLAGDYGEAYRLLSYQTRSSGNFEGFEVVQQGYHDRFGELRGYEQKGPIDYHFQDTALVAIHEILIYERKRIPFVMILKKQGPVWVVWGVIEE